MRFSSVSSHVCTPGSSRVVYPTVVSYLAIQIRQKADRPALLARNALQETPEAAGRLAPPKDRAADPCQLRRILERVLFDSRLQKEIERIERSQFRNQVHLNHKLLRLLRKKNPRQVIVVSVKLPVEKVLRGSDLQRVAENRRSAMRGRTQLYNLRTERNRLVIPVLCPVIQSNLYSHPPSCGPRLEFLAPLHSATSPEGRGSCGCPFL